VDLRELIRPDYKRATGGSSLAELAAAAEDYGLYAMPVDKLTPTELRTCPYVLILHVKPSVGSQGYNHYELFLGNVGGQARIYSPPEAASLVAFHELAPRWDGYGLIISAQPIDAARVFAPARKRFALRAGLVLAAVILIRFIRRRVPATLLNSWQRRSGVSLCQSVTLGLVTLAFALAYHTARDEGLLANANATQAIRQAHAEDFVPKISVARVKRLLGADVVFIDARFRADYEAGHLDGAISVPVDANDIERHKAVAGVTKDARIVVYCQSGKCPFAGRVAGKLIQDGFSRVSIFRQGWAAWAAKERDGGQSQR
jgi:rhodanese-related sulfurtransferase